MAQRSILPLAGSLNDVGLVKTNLINATIHLFQAPFEPTNTTTLTELEAVECDFTDYVEKTIAAWTGPVLASIPGYKINSPVQTWVVVTATVTNQVAGYWVQTAGGVLHDIVVFDAPVPMVNVGQAVQVVAEEVVQAV